MAPDGKGRPSLRAWLDACQLPIRAGASTLGYATEAVRARLGDNPCPRVRVALSVMEERSAALRRDVERVTRLWAYMALQATPLDPTPDGNLAETLRRVLDEAGAASRQRIGVKGWKHGGRGVPGQAALDAIQPVVENALVHGHGQVTVELHPDAGPGPWLTVSDSGPGMARDAAAGWLEPLARAPVTDAHGRPRLGLATAQLAAFAMGCQWRHNRGIPRGLCLQLTPLGMPPAGGPGS